ERAGWRWITPRKRIRPPGREFQRKLRQLDQGNLRRARGLEPTAFRPQAVRDARPGATRAARALVGGRLRTRDRREARETRTRIETRFTREAEVDDRADAGQGHARLGDIRREHHAPRTRRGRRERGVLRRERERA